MLEHILFFSDSAALLPSFARLDAEFADSGRRMGYFAGVDGR
jgi:hypothetical protein